MTRICVSAAASQVICAISCAVTWIQEQRYDYLPPPTPSLCESLCLPTICVKQIVWQMWRWWRKWGLLVRVFTSSRVSSCRWGRLGVIWEYIEDWMSWKGVYVYVFFFFYNNTHAAHVGYFKVDSNKKPNRQTRVGIFWQNLTCLWGILYVEGPSKFLIFKIKSTEGLSSNCGVFILNRKFPCDWYINIWHY